MPFIICDLDGTLCNIKHREHLVQAGQYEEFNAAHVNDDPHGEVQEMLWCMQNAGHSLIICSGRSEKHRPSTLEWLDKVADVHPDVVLMRPELDYRPDTVVKASLLVDHFGEPLEKIREKVLLVLEDRDKMVAFWRNNGFDCWQVRDGSY